MFEEMVRFIREDTLRRLYQARIERAPQRTAVAQPTRTNAPAETASAPASVKKSFKNVGRNDPCPCGSGLKWKKCTCKEYHPDQQ